MCKCSLEKREAVWKLQRLRVDRVVGGGRCGVFHVELAGPRLVHCTLPVARPSGAGRAADTEPSSLAAAAARSAPPGSSRKR